MTFLRRRRHRDPLECRNDRLARHDLYVMFAGDVDRATVALATYEAQERWTEDRSEPKDATGATS